MAKRSSDPRVAYPEVKVQVQDLVRVVGIVAPLPHGGSVPGENCLLLSPMGVNGQRRSVPGVPNSGAPRERSQATFSRVGIVEGSSGVNIRGKFVLSRNLGYKTRGSSCG